MKKVLPLLILLFLSVIVSNAQLNKGSKLIGGSVGYEKSTMTISNTEYDNHSFQIHPALGIATSNKDVFGIKLSFIVADYDSNIPGSNESNGYGGGFFYRRYHALSNRFNLFGEAGLNYIKSESKFESATIRHESNANSFTLNFQPGVSFSLTRNLHLEALLNNLFSISFSNTTKERVENGTALPDEKTKQFFVGSSLSNYSPFSIGIRWFAGK